VRLTDSLDQLTLEHPIVEPSRNILMETGDLYDSSGGTCVGVWPLCYGEAPCILLQRCPSWHIEIQFESALFVV